MSGAWHEPSHRFDVPGRDRWWVRKQARWAENVVRARYGLPLLPAIPDKGEGDGGIDLWLRAISVDVKWSPHHTAPLRHNLTVRTVALAYVLVTGVDDDKVIRGFAWRPTLLKAKVTDPGFGRCYEIPQSELHPSVDLLAATQGLLSV